MLDQASSRFSMQFATQDDEHLAAQQILSVLFSHRRLTKELQIEDNEVFDLSPHVFHLQKIHRFVEKGLPVHCVLPAFPAKSSNREKTLSELPDLGERLSIRFLQQVCSQIREVYSPGAFITVCSDGRVFSDLVRVEDTHVSEYKTCLSQIIDEYGSDSINQFSLDDVYSFKNFDTMREELLIDHAQSLKKVKHMCSSNPASRFLFNGIHRFIYEDERVLTPDISNNQLKEQSKDIAYRVIQRSNAWSQLVAQRYPDAVRLSIHPQPEISEKIGIKLLDIDNPWVTPWHSVVLDDGETFRLVKRKEAEQQNAWLVYDRGRPSHYVLTNATPQEFN